MPIVYYNEHRRCMFSRGVQKNTMYMLTRQKQTIIYRVNILISLKHTTFRDTSALITEEEMCTTYQLEI